MRGSITRILSILAPVIILMTASLLILHSIAPAVAIYQLIFGLIGLLLAIVVSRFDLDLLLKFPRIYYGIATFSLLATEIFGVVSRGSTRWIIIAGNQFQPSEFAKILLILFAAGWLKNHSLITFRAITKFLILMFIPFILIFIQPDLGTSLLVFSIALMGILVAGAPFKYIVSLFLAALIVVPIGIQGLKPYQKDRLVSFFSPENDPMGTGYNARQATIAVGSGQLLGRGLGQGTQSHLRFLPERHTDFIFASFIEELGFLGGMILFLAYTWFFISLLTIAKFASNIGIALVTLLSTGMLLIQTTINLGMNMGVLPITGVTLPLVSYGGSSLLSTCIIIGLNLNAAMHTKAVYTRISIG